MNARTDLRTNKGRRKEILGNIINGGLVSFNWITANKHRARVVTSMMVSGELDLKQDSGYMYRVTIKEVTK